MELLSLEKAIVKKFGFFRQGNPNFYVHQFSTSCSCGAPILCVCYRADSLEEDFIEAAHFCLNGDCQKIKKEESRRPKSSKNPGGIGHCPICWQNLDKR
jgi:hypothetical protein